MLEVVCGKCQVASHHGSAVLEVVSNDGNNWSEQWLLAEVSFLHEVECERWCAGAWCGLVVALKAKVSRWIVKLQRQLWLG